MSAHKQIAAVQIYPSKLASCSEIFSRVANSRVLASSNEYSCTCVSHTER